MMTRSLMLPLLGSLMAGCTRQPEPVDTNDTLTPTTREVSLLMAFSSDFTSGGVLGSIVLGEDQPAFNSFYSSADVKDAVLSSTSQGLQFVFRGSDGNGDFQYDNNGWMAPVNYSEGAFSLDDVTHSNLSNPYGVSIFNDGRAFIPQYDSSVLIAGDQNIDLTSADQVGESLAGLLNQPPRMSFGLQAGSIYFLSIQNLDSFWAPDEAGGLLVAFKDNAINSIRLPGVNPSTPLDYDSQRGALYLGLSGSSFAIDDNGGVAVCHLGDVVSSGNLSQLNASLCELLADEAALKGNASRVVVVPGSNELIVISSSDSFSDPDYDAAGSRVSLVNVETGVVREVSVGAEYTFQDVVTKDGQMYVAWASGSDGGVFLRPIDGSGEDTPLFSGRPVTELELVTVTEEISE